MTEMASRIPENIAVAQAQQRDSSGKRTYRTVTFQELDRSSDRIARALLDDGVKPGMRIALMVRYGADFITLVFAILKSGATLVLIDPGMGMKSMLTCLAEAEPDGFAAVSPVHAVRVFLKRRFPKAVHNLTVGKRWFWGGLSLAKIRRTLSVAEAVLVPTQPDDPAAVIFTSGSTGPAKGVLYTHRMFDAQVEQIQQRYGIQPGDVDLACFPFFGLFNAVTGAVTVIPDMNPTHPAAVNPENICEAVRDWQVNQSFASPALWKKVTEYCQSRGEKMPTLKRVISAGAPISPRLLAGLKECLLPDAEIYTPYGATESLPVASVSASEVLGETAVKTNQGAGICVGRKFASLRWCVIKITDDPIERLEDAEKMPIGQMGELAVTGPQVSPRYVTRRDANPPAKMTDTDGQIWHRIGDVGYLDAEDRFWMCGRKSHRVETASGPMFTIPCEAVFNQHPQVSRSALVGVGNRGSQIPVMYIEPKPDCPLPEQLFRKELMETACNHSLTAVIKDFLFLKSFPVDIRHNVKINRELLARQAAAWHAGS
jgi:acyl-CoA synthetase (AMP-forming)/AMP-acid ligase II